MLIRNPRVLILLAAAALAASSVLAGATVSAAAPASAQPQVTICLTNAPQFCADVKDSVNQLSQPIWLWRPVDGAHDYHWVRGTVNCSGGQGGLCTIFKDAQDQSLCLEGPGVTGHGVFLGNCGAPESQWFTACPQYGNRMTSVNDPVGGLLSVNGPLYDGRYLYATSCIAPGGAVWQSWTVG
jgi:hypothetical protein